MDKKELLILLMLRENKAFNNTTAMTLQELISTDGLAGYRVNTIYKSIQKLLEAGLVQYGLKDGHANTYSISKIGIKKIGEYADEE